MTEIQQLKPFRSSLRIMDRLRYVLCLLCVLGSWTPVADAGVITMVKEWPSSHPQAGDTVILRCEASGMKPSYVFEWTKLIVDSESLIARNGSIHNPRYEVFSSTTPDRYEHLIIPKATKDDTGLFYCRVKNATLNGLVVLGSRSLYLGVHFFPSDIYPICSPNGAFVASVGTTQLMKCTSESGNPEVQMDFTSSAQIYPLTYDLLQGVQTTSLELTLNPTHHNLSYTCKIMSQYFAGMERSCTIGPVIIQDPTRPLPLTSERIPQPSDPLPSDPLPSAGPQPTDPSPTDPPSTDPSPSDPSPNHPLSTGEPDVATAQAPVPTDAVDKNGTSVETSSNYPLALSASVGSVAGLLVLLFFIMIGVFACLGGHCKKDNNRKYPSSDYTGNGDFIDIPSIVSFEENANMNHNTPSFLLDDLSQGHPDTISTVEADDRMSVQANGHHSRPGSLSRANSSKELQKQDLSGYDSPLAYQQGNEAHGKPSNLGPSGTWQEPPYSTLKKKNSLGRGAAKKAAGAVGEDYRPAKAPDNPTSKKDSYPATLAPVVVKQVTWNKHVF